jgi:hypothetical protein
MQRRSRRLQILTAAALVGLVTAAGPLMAQDRDALIRNAQQAYDEFATARALTLLQAALDPQQGPRDSIWAHAVHLMAQIHVEQEDRDNATAWLRWARRLYPTMPVDQVFFLPEVLSASAEARAFVQRATETEGVVETTWQWSTGAPDPPGQGRIRVLPSGLTVPVRVVVQGRLVQEGGTLLLPVGSYDIQAAGTGYLSSRIAREVLPGVTTILEFTLQRIGAVAQRPPAVDSTALPEAVATSARQQLAKLSVRRFGPQAECRVGFYVGGSYIVTTYQAIRGADSVEVAPERGAPVRAGVRVAHYDVNRNVAVLKLPTVRRDSLSLGEAVAPQQHVWAYTYPGCATASLTNTRVAAVDGTIRTSDRAGGGELGGVVLDRAGNAVGLASASDQAIPSQAIAAVLTEARRKDRLGQLVVLADVARAEGAAPAQPAAPPPPVQVAQRRGKKFPWPIALLGVAGAGAAVVLLAGGGGGNGNGNGGTTGGIIISVPNR